MLRAGNTATRTREWMEGVARKLGFDAVAVSLTLDTITVSMRRAGAAETAMCEVGPPGLNVWRIGELEQLARTAEPGLAPSKIAARLDEIEFAPPLYSAALLAVAIGAASGGFAFLHRTAPLQMTAAAIGGGIGQSGPASPACRPAKQFGLLSP